MRQFECADVRKSDIILGNGRSNRAQTKCDYAESQFASELQKGPELGWLTISWSLRCFGRTIFRIKFHKTAPYPHAMYLHKCPPLVLHRLDYTKKGTYATFLKVPFLAMLARKIAGRSAPPANPFILTSYGRLKHFNKNSFPP